MGEKGDQRVEEEREKGEGVWGEEWVGEEDKEVKG